MVLKIFFFILFFVDYSILFFCKYNGCLIMMKFFVCNILVICLFFSWLFYGIFFEVVKKGKEIVILIFMDGMGW